MKNLVLWLNLVLSSKAGMASLSLSFALDSKNRNFSDLFIPLLVNNSWNPSVVNNPLDPSAVSNPWNPRAVNNSWNLSVVNNP